MRLTTIDGFRGIFLVFMVVHHVNAIVNTVVGKLNHHSFGWVEDAQGFVFMSGLVIGLVYGGRLLRHDETVMRKAVWKRIRTIYSHQIGLILCLLAASFLYVFFGQTPPQPLSPYAEAPLLFTGLSALMVTASMHMGILPMYIFFMMVTPFCLRLLNARRYMTFAALVIASWVIAQTRVLDIGVTTAQAGLAAIGHPVKLGIYFNVFGWEVVFFGGLLIGFLMTAKRLQTEFLRREDMRTVVLICFGMLVFFGLLRRIVAGDWFGTEFSALISLETDRGNFSLIHLMAFATDLLIVVWLLGPGLSDRNRLLRGLARGLHRFVTFRPFVFLGEHSLHVFSAHILIVYAIDALYRDKPPGELIGTLWIFVSVSLLFGAAWLHAKSVGRKKGTDGA